MLLEHLVTFGRGKGFFQQFLDALGTDPLAPLDERARIAWQVMLEVLHTAKELPVWIFQKASKHSLIGEIIEMLDVMQGDQQTSGKGRSAKAVRIQRTELHIEDLPVDGFGQQVKRMLWVEHFAQKRGARRRGGLSRLSPFHEITR